jgi:hypothetical protein
MAHFAATIFLRVNDFWACDSGFEVVYVYHIWHHPKFHAIHKFYKTFKKIPRVRHSVLK